MLFSTNDFCGLEPKLSEKCDPPLRTACSFYKNQDHTNFYRKTEAPFLY